MIRYLWVAVVVLVLALLWSLRSGAAADQRARTAAHQVDSLTSLRKAAESVARADSLKLEESRTAAVVRESELEAERARSLGKASQAHEQADTALVALGAVLDSLGASHEALDRLNQAHAAEIAEKDRQIVLADSATAVEHSLRLVTETALASERVAHRATADVASGLQVQVAALKAGKRRDRIGAAALVIGVVAVAILRP